MIRLAAIMPVTLIVAAACAPTAAIMLGEHAMTVSEIADRKVDIDGTPVLVEGYLKKYSGGPKGTYYVLFYGEIARTPAGRTAMRCLGGGDLSLFIDPDDLQGDGIRDFGRVVLNGTFHIESNIVSQGHLENLFSMSLHPASITRISSETCEVF